MGHWVSYPRRRKGTCRTTSGTTPRKGDNAEPLQEEAPILPSLTPAHSAAVVGVSFLLHSTILPVSRIIHGEIQMITDVSGNSLFQH